MEDVKCDLCGANKPEFLFKGVDRFSKSSYSLAACSQCGLVYLPSRPTKNELEQYYPDDYEAYYILEDDRLGSEQWHLQRALRIQLDFIEQHTLDKGDLLDIGCATGNFLKIAQDNGWQVTGIEPIDKAAVIARTQYHLKVITGTLDEIQFDPESFDVITMWDVLEHLPNPKQTLVKCHGLLKPGGIIVFSIPNLRSYDRYLFGEHWIGWDPPRHFNLFTDSTLVELLAVTGFEPVDKHCIIGGKGTFLLSLDNIISEGRLGTIIRKFYPLLSAILWPYRQFSYLFDRGPIITYAVRKS